MLDLLQRVEYSCRQQRPQKARWCSMLLCLVPIGFITAQTATAQIRVLAISSSAGFTPGLPFVGSLASVGLVGLTGIHGIESAAAGYPLPYELSGVSVTVDGTPAPLLAVADLGWYQQINIQVPAYQDQSHPRTLEVSQFGQTGRLDIDFYSKTAFGAGAWGVFFADAAGYAAVQHADYTLVTRDHPAHPDEILIAYCTNLDDFSDVTNAPVIGYPAPADPLPTLTVVPYISSRFSHVTVDDKTFSLIYAGLSPGSVGLYQINFRLPSDTPTGDAVLKAATNNNCFGSAMCPSVQISQGVKIPVRVTGLQ